MSISDLATFLTIFQSLGCRDRDYRPYLEFDPLVGRHARGPEWDFESAILRSGLSTLRFAAWVHSLSLPPAAQRRE